MSHSKRWLSEHHSDFYVKKARDEGYRSRAAYKLLEIQEKERLIRPGMVVVDLGAAPGGWSIVANQLVGKTGQVYALDILPMDPIEGVEFILGDFTEQSTLDALLLHLNKRVVDVVFSDMAPNLSGNKSIDQPRMMLLLELAFECAGQILRPGGSFLTKIFQGEGIDAYIRALRKSFKIVKTRKPDASRSRSSEVYILAKDFIGYTEPFHF